MERTLDGPRVRSSPARGLKRLERASTREPLNNLLNRRVSVGSRLERARAKTESPGNGAPQRFDKIESAPGNGRVSEASTHNIWYTGARLPRPTPAVVPRAGGTPREEGAARGRRRLSARLARRPGSLADSVMELRVTRPHLPFVPAFRFLARHAVGA
jgi:hypothetical protein